MCPACFTGSCAGSGECADGTYCWGSYEEQAGEVVGVGCWDCAECEEYKDAVEGVDACPHLNVCGGDGGVVVVALA